jgi:phthalate 4,5-cis-dihydrodiol dehydrogenase
LDGSRPAIGHCVAFLEFENDAAASVVFSAYDFFDSDELHHWIAEGGTTKEPHRQGKTREAFLARASNLEAHQALGFGARMLPTEQPHLPHFGFIVVTCERGDMRLSPNGILIHGTDGTREVAVPRGPGRPGQGDALDALWEALREGRRCVHDARWGRGTVEIILAILQSSKSHREVRLSC